MRLLIVTTGSTSSISFISESICLMTLPALGAHEPFSTIPALLLQYPLVESLCRKSCMGVNSEAS